MEESRSAMSPSRSETADAKRSKRAERGRDDEGEEIGAKEEEYDVQGWDTFSRTFVQVQSVLDQNSSLIQQVNDNHKSKIPENLAKNVSLIHELNDNMSKVLGMYSDLSILVKQRRSAIVPSKTDRGDGGSDPAKGTAKRGEH